MEVNNIKDLYYNQKLGMVEIASKLNVNISRIRRLMKKHKLLRRTASESNHYRFLRTANSFTKKSNLTETEKELLIAGLMLYWAEGCKPENKIVDLANSKPKIVILFLKMLREIYQVQENRIRILLYCYSNQNPEELITKWSEILKIPKTQFIKPFIKKTDTLDQKNKTPLGVIHIRYSDVRLINQIFEDIDIIYEQLCRGGGVDNHTSL